jgi:hypothetical protein
MVYAWFSVLFSPTSRGGNAIAEKNGESAAVDFPAVEMGSRFGVRGNKKGLVWLYLVVFGGGWF